MNTRILLISALTSLLGLVSCDGGSSVPAQELTGTWKGQATQMTPPANNHRKHKDSRVMPEGTEMSCTPTLTFIRADGTKGGRIEIAADYSVTQEVESVMSKIPVNATVSGNLKASGTWIVDDDDIKVMLDASETKVEVDTSSVALSYARLTDAPKDSLISIRERVMDNIAATVGPMVSERISKFRGFEDVSITDNIMTLEIGKNMMTFTKQ